MVARNAISCDAYGSPIGTDLAMSASSARFVHDPQAVLRADTLMGN